MEREPGEMLMRTITQRGHNNTSLLVSIGSCGRRW